MTVKRDRRAG